MSFFTSVPPSREPGVSEEVAALAARAGSLPVANGDFSPLPDERALEVYNRVEDPDDPFELRDLWLGRVEHESGEHALRPELARRWRESRVRRDVRVEDVLTSRATVRFVKELFNSYFRDDLYGELRRDGLVILSGGSVDEQAWGLPETLKDCVRFALSHDYYGYSDSRGREPARAAIAEYENARMTEPRYDVTNVAMTMGGTFAVSSLADFVLHGTPGTGSPALCGIPNYPPLVEAVARRRPVQLVPVASSGGRGSLDGLIAALRPDTPLVLLQSVANPTGAAVPESELRRLIQAASPSTMILIDECHEWLGTRERVSTTRAAANVVRISSLSKTWSAPGMKVGWFLADSRFVEEYYEYASTTFGGPPSFFYTLVEVLARMERWLIDGVTSPNAEHAAEFESGYQVDLPQLRLAFDSYREERLRRESGLTALRDATTAWLGDLGAEVIPAPYSINTAVRFAGWDDSYLCFRDLLRTAGVSVFPGILTFCFSGGLVRVTTARRWGDLRLATDRLRSALQLSGATS